jgi:hypothetical protein
MITRRQFNARALGAAISARFARAMDFAWSFSGGGAQSGRETLSPGGDPSGEGRALAGSDAASSTAGDFTPFGYLDNPYHCWNLHRSGILRSLPGIGFGLYFPAGPGGYFDDRKNGIYHAFLRLGFSIGTRRLWAPEDFREGELSALHHSKNVLTYKLPAEGMEVHCSFFQVAENALAARVEFKKLAEAADAVRLIAAHEYQLGHVGRGRHRCGLRVTR